MGAFLRGGNTGKNPTVRWRFAVATESRGAKAIFAPLATKGAEGDRRPCIAHHEKP